MLNKQLAEQIIIRKVSDLFRNKKLFKNKLQYAFTASEMTFNRCSIVLISLGLHHINRQVCLPAYRIDFFGNSPPRSRVLRTMFDLRLPTRTSGRDRVRSTLLWIQNIR